MLSDKDLQNIIFQFGKWPAAFTFLCPENTRIFIFDTYFTENQRDIEKSQQKQQQRIVWKW